MTLKLVHRSGNIWATYRDWFQGRGEEPPKPPPHGIWVIDGDPLSPWPCPLIAGVCLYPSEGEWTIVEHVATNPRASKEQRNAALLVMTAALRAYGAMTGKMPLCFPNDPSIERRLLLAGWKHSTACAMITDLVADTGVEVKKTTPDAGGAPGVARRTTSPPKVRPKRRSVK